MKKIVCLLIIIMIFSACSKEKYPNQMKFIFYPNVDAHIVKPVSGDYLGYFGGNTWHYVVNLKISKLSQNALLTQYGTLITKDNKASQSLTINKSDGSTAQTEHYNFNMDNMNEISFTDTCSLDGWYSNTLFYRAYAITKDGIFYGDVLRVDL